MFGILIQLASILFQLSLLVAARPRFSTPSFLHPTKRLLAFVDKSKTICSMASAAESKMTDADAYHEMVSAAVDLSSVYVRNGIITG